MGLTASIQDRRDYSAVESLRALEMSLQTARVLASRASELDVDEQLGELHQVIVERRRRAERAAHR